MSKQKKELIAGLKCQDVADRLSDFYDGDIPDDLCHKIERHVESCSDCYAVFNTFNKTIELYKQEADNAEIPDEVRHRLHTVLHLEDLLKKDH